MRTRSFPSGTLPDPGGMTLRRLLHRAHEQDPFSPLRPRAAARRVGALASEIGLAAHLYRGGVELMGAEVDHVWLALDDLVIDLAFPLFAPSFRALLPRFVAGEIEAVELEKAAASTGVEERVLGVLPPRVRYVGRPVWVDRGLESSTNGAA
ncbi:MAG TPA: hypothetical protein VK875_00815 [Euzebyales bacterium]|nr:hypothetical protein [Euzebyales bacterium]